MSVAEAEWIIVHGDTSRSPAFAVCDARGGAIDLEQWVIRAQARATVDSYDLIFGWSIGHGIDLSIGTITLTDGSSVDTSTVALSLLPGDFAGLPRDWSGIVEIEVASDSTTSPAKRYSIARLWTTIIGDVTRDDGTLVVSPGVPAPFAPAGGVLAGAYPNPIFAVPMATKSDLNVAIAASSVNDRERGLHTGTQSADTLTDGATKRAFLATERDKLAAIPPDATHNSSDAYLLNRANHTGSMFSTAVSDFAEAVQDTMGQSFVEGTNISIAYNDANGTFTISSSGGGGGSGGGSGGISGVRTTNGNGNAFTGELLLVDASGGQVTIGPPPGAPIGTQVTIVKSDPSSNLVVWNAPTNSDTSAGFSKQWSGATFTWSGSFWVLTSTNRTNSYAVGGGGSVSDGSVTDASVAANAAVAETKLALASDAAAGVASRRTLGTGATQAAAGNHGHTPASIGAAATSHTHGVADLTATGTRDSTTVLYGDNTWKTAPTGGGGGLTPTGEKTAAYTASPGELVMVNASSGPLTITAPATGAGRTFGVKKLDSSTNVVTVARAGTDTIGSEGATSVPIWLNDQATHFLANGANWVIPYNHLALNMLDARFRLASARVSNGGVVDLGTLASGAIAPDASLASQFTVTATGNLTLNAPTSPSTGQGIAVVVTASGAARTITLSGSILLTLGQTATFTVNSGKVGYLLLRRDADAWVCLNMSQRS